MFIKTAVFKRLADAAYKGGGLLIGNTGEDYIISGSYWAIKVRIDFFPKKEKAVIIALTGEFPTKGKFFRADKSGNQYEFGNEDDLILSALSQETEVLYHVTKNTTEISNCKFFIIQNKANLDVRFMKSVFADLIDNKEIDEDEESPAIGPSSRDKDSDMIIWKNEISSVVSFLYVPYKETDQYEYLQNYQSLLENMELQ